MSIKGLERVIANLNSINKRAVPCISAQTVNCIAMQTVSRSVSAVTKSIRVPRRLVRQRARIRRATVEKPRALIHIDRGNLPAIRLGLSSMRLLRRKRDKSGASSELRVGHSRFSGAFIQQLANGHWHVLWCTIKSRYPIEVVSIPLSVPLTETFRAEMSRLVDKCTP